MISEALQKARDYEAANGPLVPEHTRPVFHFTPDIGWLNDPNGFSVYRGEYHLFYQYHPFSSMWGPMHWGHAKTRDFLSWDRLGAALAPDSDYDLDGCWSGSAAEMDDGRQLLLYTGRRTREDGNTYQTQCLAVGDGRDYEKYAGNPVLTGADLPEGCSPYDFREPKLWREADGSFRAVAVAMAEDGDGAALLFSSPDGFAWRFERVLDRSRNEYGTMWECPDFFPLDGKQALLVSPMAVQPREPDFHGGFGAIALLGQYSGGAFTRETVQTLDHGPDFYAAQTLETPDGRRILIAWMQNWDSAKVQPDERLCYAGFTVPRELSIRDGRLIQKPVRELDGWHGEPVVCQDVEIAGETALDGVRGRVLDLSVAVRPTAENRRFRISIASDGTRRTTLDYFPERGMVRVERDRDGAPAGVDHAREFAVQPKDGALRLRLVLDRRSLELFVNGGEQAATFLLYTPESAEGILFEAEGGPVRADVTLWPVKKPCGHPREG